MLLTEMKLFDIRKEILTSFKNGFIRPLNYQGSVELKTKPEKSIGEEKN